MGSGGNSDTPLFSTEGTKKQFMSIATKNGAVYHPIIDHDKKSKKVHILSEVTNAEFANFTPQDEAEKEPDSQRILMIKSVKYSLSTSNPIMNITSKKKVILK